MKYNSKNITYVTGILILVGLTINRITPKKEFSGPGNTFNPTVTSVPDLGILEVSKADKIEVFNFHRTQRCWSCLTLGKLSEKTIKEKFAEESVSGKVVFKAINIELPENNNIVNLFKASGSSLYINAIKDGNNHIEQNMKVWQFLSDESAFTSYLEEQIRSLL